jgi:Ankyrin repeats (many copies)
MTALRRAADGGDASMVEKLVSLLGTRLDVNAKDTRRGYTALHAATEKGHRSVVETLVSLCGDRLDENAKDTFRGYTALTAHTKPTVERALELRERGDFTGRPRRRISHTLSRDRAGVTIERFGRVALSEQQVRVDGVL